jgi:hypothetical protein
LLVVRNLQVLSHRATPPPHSLCDVSTRIIG